MKNFSSITENLDITTKKYVDDNKVTSVDGLSGGTLTSPLKISGGNQSTASKISLDQSANGQITDSSTSTLFGFMSSTTLTVGGNSYALALRGSGTRPTYKGADLALYSDIATVPTDYVKYTAQTLTDAQKSQARSNIGAGTSNFSGNYNDLSNKPSIPANYTTSSLTPSQCTANGFYYVSSSVNSLTDANGNPFLQYHTSNNDFRILATAYSDSWVQQIATDFRSTHIYYRIRNNGTWGAWIEVAKISDIPDVSGKANLNGGNTFSGNQVITGYLDIRGTAAEKHLKTRGIGGSDGNGNSSDLYLQYSSDYKTYFGNTAQSSLNADGSISINGKTAATTDQIKAQVAYGTCATAAATAAKEVKVSDTTWTLKVGTIVGVKFTNTNTASNVTINVNGTGAKSIWYNNAKQTSNSSFYAGYANRLIYYMYDGTYWCWLNAGTDNDTLPSGMSWTGASTAAKTATCHNYNLLAKSYLQVIMIYSNTAKSALTLNVNGKGAKPIYINGAASSTTNYTLPAGSYFVYYDGTNYYFRTDGNLTVRGSVAMTKADFSLSGTTLTITL